MVIALFRLLMMEMTFASDTRMPMMDCLQSRCEIDRIRQYRHSLHAYLVQFEPFRILRWP